MHTNVRVQELETRNTEILARLNDLNDRHSGEAFPDEARKEWNQLNQEKDANDLELLSIKSRLRKIMRLSRSAQHLEGPVFDTPAPGQRGDYGDRQLQALRAVERLNNEGEIGEAGILRLDEAIRKDPVGNDAAYHAAVSDPDYRRAFSKMMFYGPDSYKLNLSEKERNAFLRVQEAQRAASLTTTAGGFAVPVQLDPSVILTNSGAINPLRKISRVETISGSNEWRGVTSAGITASYDAEASEVSDDTPTLGQPIAYAEMARAFVPYSIEVGSDWEAFESEMARLFLDAKDSLEASKFVLGGGHSAIEPEGLLVGGTAVISTAAATTLAIGDLYSLKQALPARWRTNATFVGNDITFDKVKRFVGGGNTTEQPIWNDVPTEILRRPALEQTSMPSAVTSGNTIMTVGDFSNFLILDRLGFTIEPVQTLFHTSNNRPSGQRGLFAYWRSSSKVLNPLAFRSLKYT